MKRYLGDGVYVEVDSSGSLVLTTENGIAVTNRIVLESAVFQSLIDYVTALRAARLSGRAESLRQKE